MSTLPSDLFDAAPQWPRGLTYTLDFIGVEEERQLLAALCDVPMHDAQYYDYTAKRRIASFGSSYDFDGRCTSGSCTPNRDGCTMPHLCLHS